MRPNPLDFDDFSNVSSNSHSLNHLFEWKTSRLSWTGHPYHWCLQSRSKEIDHHPLLLLDPYFLLLVRTVGQPFSLASKKKTRNSSLYWNRRSEVNSPIRHNQCYWPLDPFLSHTSRLSKQNTHLIHCFTTAQQTPLSKDLTTTDLIWYLESWKFRESQLMFRRALINYY